MHVVLGCSTDDYLDLTSSSLTATLNIKSILNKVITQRSSLLNMAVETSIKAEVHEAQLSHHEGDTLEKQSKPGELEELNLHYDDLEHEPEIHIHTYFAVAAMLFLNYVQVIALQGPPLVVSGCIGDNI